MRTQFYDRDPSAPEPNRPRALSVYALIDRADDLLLELRRDAPLWSLIAGRVEDGESLLQGLTREVAEETGLVVTGATFFGHFSDPGRIVSYPDGNTYSLVSLAYLVSVESFEPLRAGPESREVRFYSREALRGVEVPATQRRVLDRYLAGAAGPHLE
ncbi:MAG: NUDIX domain-containing protein [Gaiellaceae bacterium]